MSGLAAAPTRVEQAAVVAPRDAHLLRAQHAHELPVRLVRVRPARETRSRGPDGAQRDARDGREERELADAAKADTARASHRESAGVEENVEKAVEKEAAAGEESGGAGTPDAQTASAAPHDHPDHGSAALDNVFGTAENDAQLEAFATKAPPEDFVAAVADFEAKRAAVLYAFAKRTARDVEIQYTDSDPAGRKHYVGSTRGGKPHGRGTLTWACGSCYNGEFRNDKLTGMGVYTWSNGKRYVGQWLDGKACGYGVLTSRDPEMMVYRGTWQEGLMHGFGRLELGNGDVYEGGWLFNSKEGPGVYVWANGDRYEGDFASHQMHGQGLFTWPNGRKLATSFSKHAPVDAWALARALWMLMTFASVAYVAIYVVGMLAKDLDAYLDTGTSAWVRARLGIRIRSDDLSSPLSEPADEDPQGFAVGVRSWLSEVVRHELALPHIRIMLLLTLRSTLEEIFANIIANVASAYCHAQALPISDRQSWHQGLALGCAVVILLASLHMLIYAFM